MCLAEAAYSKPRNRKSALNAPGKSLFRSYTKVLLCSLATRNEPKPQWELRVARALFFHSPCDRSPSSTARVTSDGLVDISAIQVLNNAIVRSAKLTTVHNCLANA